MAKNKRGRSVTSKLSRHRGCIIVSLVIYSDNKKSKNEVGVTPHFFIVLDIGGGLGQGEERIHACNHPACC